MTAPTLTGFLLARIAEEEGWATAARGWQTGSRHEGQPLDWSIHMDRWSPARVLAECEAKRRIVEYRGAIGLPEDGSVRPGEGMTYLDGGHAAVAAERERILRLLALPYSDHPDYDDAWRP